MRLGCMLLIVAVIAVCGFTAGAVWVGLRMVEEPEVSVAPGTPEDGIRSQQKIYEIVGAVPGRGKGRPRQIILSEPELNAFLSRHLGEASKFPFGNSRDSFRSVGFWRLPTSFPLAGSSGRSGSTSGRAPVWRWERPGVNDAIYASTLSGSRSAASQSRRCSWASC